MTPDEVIGEEEHDRLKARWDQRFRRGGSGRVVVAQSALKVQLLQQSMGDLVTPAELGVTKELIMNAFHVPAALFTSSTNPANLLALHSQHMDQVFGPKHQRRNERLNAQLVPLLCPRAGSSWRARTQRRWPAP